MNNFYRAFEDRYRGSRELIAARLRVYQGFLAQLGALHGKATALDLGCGRGEWLELLAEAGFDGRGVDLDEGMLAACRERGLAVERADALSILRAQPDASLALVSAFHLVEHIPFEALQELIGEARRVLLPGGLLIMETPNPENLVVGASSFYMDPSHLQPIPPRLLDFAAEYGGFGRRKVLRLQEAAHLHGAAPLGLLDVLDGVSPDYSVVAQKDAAPAALSGFEALFEASHGYDLAALAQRYEIERSQLHAKLAGAVGGFEERLQRAEAHGALMERRVIELLSSSSWRITAPLRALASAAAWAGARVGLGTLARAALRRAKPGLRQLVKLVLRRPGLKQAARAVLRHMPGLQARIHGMMYSAGQPDWPLGEGPPGEVSPRAMRALRELEAARAARKH